jgi:hypothetical protein
LLQFKDALDATLLTDSLQLQHAWDVTLLTLVDFFNTRTTLLTYSLHFQQACDVTFALDFLCNFQRSLDTAPFTLSLQFYDAFDATPLTFFPISTRS